MLDSARAYTYFDRTFCVRRSTNGWFTLDCPFCGKRGKGAVHFAYQRYKCWSCDYREGILRMVKDYHGIGYSEAIELVNSFESSGLEFEGEAGYLSGGTPGIIKPLPLSLPVGFHPILTGEGIIGRRARAYLEGRGLDLEEMDALGVGYCSEEGPDKTSDFFAHVVFPFKKRGRLYYYVGRNLLEIGQRYKNPPTESVGVGKAELLFNEDLLDYEPQVYICEGIFDALTMGNAVALLGKTLSDVQRTKLRQAANVKEYVVCLDAGCRAESLKIALELCEEKPVKVLELEGGDPNELGKEHVQQLAALAPVMTFYDLITKRFEK